jgi:uncharacterized protein (DUF2141 family)
MEPFMFLMSRKFATSFKSPIRLDSRSLASQALAARLWLALVAACLGATPAVAADLTVVVQNIQSNAGQVMLGLFGNGADFPKTPTQGVQAPAVGRDASGRLTFLLRNLAPGSYALSAYHDLDANGRLNSNLLGVPSEPYGFSNNARGTLSPPSFQAATFTLPEQGLTLELRVQ